MKVKGRAESSNIEDISTNDKLASAVLSSMKNERKKASGSMNAWDYLMSPTPISSSSNKFQSKMKTGKGYSYQSKGK